MPKIIVRSEQQFTPDEDFIVHNSRGILLFIIFAFALLFVTSISLYETINNYNFIRSLVLFLIPIVSCSLMLKNRKPIIIVNKTAIYASGKMVTDWDHFIEAFFTQQIITDDTTDNFILIIRYSKDAIAGSFKTIIPLSNTQNKSEEEVIAAIKYFNNLYSGNKKI